jgi:hypothetical protein
MVQGYQWFKFHLLGAHCHRILLAYRTTRIYSLCMTTPATPVCRDCERPNEGMRRVASLNHRRA